jgi:hypothetical protein
MKESDPKAYLCAMLDVQRLKSSRHTHARTVFDLGPFSMVRMDTRPWSEVPEQAKLAMLKDLVNWEGVSPRDMAMIMLRELDVGKLTPAQRGELISMAEPEPLKRGRPAKAAEGQQTNGQAPPRRRDRGEMEM